MSRYEIEAQINKKFYSVEKLVKQVEAYRTGKQEEYSGRNKTKFAYAIFGLVLMIFGGIISMASMNDGGGILFTGIIGIGLGLFIRGIFIDP